MFKNVKCSSIEADTIKKINEFNTINEREDIKSASQAEITLLDGIPVHPETKRFVERLRAQYRGCKFGVNRECKTAWSAGHLVYNDVWLMMPGQAYALARVGYGDYSPSGSGTSMFMVHSRTIENEKYRVGSEQYNMVMSSDIERAFKNAKKHVRMYSPVEYASLTAKEFVSHVESDSDTVRNDWMRARGQVKDNDNLYKELKHLMECGHKFLSDEFAGLVTNWIDTAKAWSVEKNRKVPAYFVHVSVVRDQQLFEVIEIDDAKGPLGNYSQTWADAKPQRFAADDIPEDIMGKLSVLSLLEPGGYSAGVGKRVDEAMFWVERT